MSEIHENLSERVVKIFNSAQRAVTFDTTEFKLNCTQISAGLEFVGEEGYNLIGTNFLELPKLNYSKRTELTEN